MYASTQDIVNKERKTWINKWDTEVIVCQILCKYNKNNFIMNAIIYIRIKK